MIRQMHNLVHVCDVVFALHSIVSNSLCKKRGNFVHLSISKKRFTLLIDEICVKLSKVGIVRKLLAVIKALYCHAIPCMDLFTFCKIPFLLVGKSI